MEDMEALGSTAILESITITITRATEEIVVHARVVIQTRASARLTHPPTATVVVMGTTTIVNLIASWRISSE